MIGSDRTHSLKHIGKIHISSVHFPDTYLGLSHIGSRLSKVVQVSLSPAMYSRVELKKSLASRVYQLRPVL